jgi:hypothetical protein
MAIFAAVSLAIIAVVGGLMAMAYPSAAEQRAIWISAGLAFVVQLFAFAVARMMARENVIAGWGLGALLRLLVLAVYGFVFVKALALPSTPALLSLAAFFFLSTLVEPLLLNL